MLLQVSSRFKSWGKLWCQISRIWDLCDRAALDNFFASCLSPIQAVCNLARWLHYTMLFLIAGNFLATPLVWMCCNRQYTSIIPFSLHLPQWYITGHNHYLDKTLVQYYGNMIGLWQGTVIGQFKARCPQLPLRISRISTGHGSREFIMRFTYRSPVRGGYSAAQ